MKTKASASAALRREQLEQSALFLSDNCPVDLTNPIICPLHDLRRFTLVERQKWVAGLTLKDLKYLVQYHETCAIERRRNQPPRPKRNRKTPNAPDRAQAVR